VLLESLVVNRPYPYAVQQPDGTYRWIHALCELEDLAAHLDGEWTLALSSTDRQAPCNWLCLDVEAVGEAVARAARAPHRPRRARVTAFR
jgi:hypothetical protein